jgi:predicted RNase H-like HicB family nuclease
MTQATATRKKLTYTVMLLADAEEGGYAVMVPALPGCVTQGETVQEALEMAREVIELWAESMVKDGFGVIEEEAGSLLTRVEVEVEVPDE